MDLYDEFLYAGFPFPQTHPDRLAVHAMLAGMTPAPPSACRILEIGCGDGGNLIPMALELPDSRFVGIDLAASPVVAARRIIETLGLSNIDIGQLDLMDFRDDGEFDYIIAHGFWSWVPAPVRERLLDLCRTRLSTHGIAFISYNAWPGSHFRQMMRGMMRFHVRGIEEPRARITAARELIATLAGARTSDDAASRALAEFSEELAKSRDAAVLHDHLAPINEPVSIQEFAELAGRYELQYVGEAEFVDTLHGRLSAAMADVVSRYAGGDVIAAEQYVDYLVSRKFRQTLLCHQHIALDRTPDPARIAELYVASQASDATPGLDVRSTTEATFRIGERASMSTNHPLTRAALTVLAAEWPRAVQFRELVRSATAAAGIPAGVADEATDDTRLLGSFLLRACGAGLVELHSCASGFVTEVSDRPRASPLSRLQLQNGSIATSLRHTSVRIEDEIGRNLLLLLDGTRDRNELIDQLARRLASGRPGIRRSLESGMDRGLNDLARLALLVA